ncbi:MAG: PAS domain-containing protein [Gammaproteobacteria bacterium]|nr:PAS domain-containing protein [Gammaproteobacteria bacterium]
MGHVFLAEKADGEAFTDADEAALLLFASQAAAAVANARAHRAERRARADLEALIETSPVGVVVFEAGTGRPVSVNREARRVVGSLRPPGRSVEELLEVVACHRADGRRVSLAEFPIAGQLAAGETVRAEEIVLSVPDGRSVRTPVNSTPIRSADGAEESVVVTLQDLAPLEEIERLRVEFLALVAHELRAPLTAIKGSAATLLDEMDLDRAEMREFHRIIAEQCAGSRCRRLHRQAFLANGAGRTGAGGVTPARDSAPFVLGTLSVDYGRRRASVEGREIGLTATEGDLLAALSRDAGRIVTYETLLRTVWRGRPHASANLVRIFVRTLRRKLGDAAAEPVWIFNERGVGYRMPAP